MVEASKLSSFTHNIFRFIFRCLQRWQSFPTSLHVLRSFSLITSPAAMHSPCLFFAPCDLNSSHSIPHIAVKYISSHHSNPPCFPGSKRMTQNTLGWWTPKSGGERGSDYPK